MTYSERKEMILTKIIDSYWERTEFNKKTEKIDKVLLRGRFFSVADEMIKEMAKISKKAHICGENFNAYLDAEDILPRYEIDTFLENEGLINLSDRDRRNHKIKNILK